VRTINFDPITVPVSAPSDLPGTAIVTNDQMRGAVGAQCIIINSSVELAIVGEADPAVPGSVVGTISNASVVIAANSPYVMYHRSGPVYALSLGGIDAAVKVSIECDP